MKKFELTSDFITNAFGVKLFRIRALVEFGDVKAGDLGGFIEKEENLNQDGDAWSTATPGSAATPGSTATPIMRPSKGSAGTTGIPRFFAARMGKSALRAGVSSATWKSFAPSSSALTETGSWRKNTLPLPI